METVRNAGSEPLFIFDLGYGGRKEKFAEALDFAIDTAGVKLLGFPYKSYATSSVSYDVLASHVENDVVFISLEVPREEFVYSLSTMHYLPFLGNDIFAVERPTFRYDTKSDDTNTHKKRIPIISKDKIKFFNSDNLLIEPSSGRLKSPGVVLDEIREGGNQKLLEIVNDYTAINTEQDKLSVIKYLSRVHELKSSTSEFQRLNRSINSNESTEYIKDKSYLQTSLTTLRSTKKGT